MFSYDRMTEGFTCLLSEILQSLNPVPVNTLPLTLLCMKQSTGAIWHILLIWSGLALYIQWVMLHIEWPGVAFLDRPKKNMTQQLSDTPTHTTSNGGPLAMLKCVIFSIFSLPAHVFDCWHTSPQLSPSGLFASRRLLLFHLILIILSCSPYSCSTKYFSYWWFIPT